MRTFRKAVAGFVSAGGGAFALTLTDGTFTLRETLAALGVGIAAFAVVYRIPNAPS